MREEAGSIEAREVSSLLASLLDKSLITRDPAGRFAMLESLRVYGRERLEAGGEIDNARSRFFDYLLALAEEAEPHLGGAEQAAWLERLEEEHDNLRSAFAAVEGTREDAFSTENAPAPRLAPLIHQDPEAALRLAGRVWRFWQMRGYIGEGRAFLSEALALAGRDADPAVRCRAMNAAGGLAWAQDDLFEASALYQRALDICRDLGDPVQEAGLLNNLGNVAYRQNDYARARAYFEQALQINRRTNRRRGIAANLNNLGTIAKEQADYGAAEALFRLALAANLADGNRAWAASNLSNLGLLALRRGDVAEARSATARALAYCLEVGARHEVASMLETLAGISAETGTSPENLYHAVTLWSAAGALRREMGVPVAAADCEDYLRDLDRARDALGKPAFDAAWAEGQALSWEEAVRLALGAPFPAQGM